MIKAMIQAVAVQKRRVDSGKRGYAKAVRRFIASANTGSYRETMNSLPVNWLRPKASAQA